MKKHTKIKRSINRGIRYFGVLSGLLLICNCAVYKTGFECPPGPGEGCKSVSQVNAMVSRGEIGGNITVWQKEDKGTRIESESTTKRNITVHKPVISQSTDKVKRKGCSCSRK